MDRTAAEGDSPTGAERQRGSESDFEDRGMRICILPILKPFYRIYDTNFLKLTVLLIFLPRFSILELKEKKNLHKYKESRNKLTKEKKKTNKKKQQKKNKTKNKQTKYT